MKVSTNWLQTYFEKPIPKAAELAELFTFHSFEIEGVEAVGSDAVIDAKILPDRAHYCLSHNGIAEEVSVLTGVAAKNRYVDAIPASIDAQPKTSIAPSAADFCKRITLRRIENISVEPSPAWLASALETVGQRSISSIVDLTNYVMLDIGQPLHAFDADKIKGDIVIRAAKDGEIVTLLDGREITLTSQDSVIADEEGALDIAGVKGGKKAEITNATKNIIMTSANFHPTAVRKTSTKYNLRNEASKRFENEITPELALHGMSNVSALIKELYPEAKFGPVIDLYPTKAAQAVIIMDPAFISRKLGIEIPAAEAKAILEKFSIAVAENSASEWSLTIPHHRLDLVIAEDIAEEVGRVYGYDKILGVLPPVNDAVGAALKPAVNSEFYLAEKAKNALAGAGFSEVMLYTLVAKGDFEIAYPLASDKAKLRTTLSPLMLKSLETNARNADLLGLDSIKQFEIGKVFSKPNGLANESIALAIGACQVKKVKGVKSDMIVNEAFAKLSAALMPIIGRELKPAVSVEGNCVVGEVILDAGMLEVAAKTDTYADLNLTRAIETEYKPFSPYPFIVRDIALFTPDSVTEAEVWAEIEKGIADEDSLDLLARHALFDVFKKEGKTSYAFRTVFQSMTETLTNDDANLIMEKVYFRTREKGWEVR